MRTIVDLPADQLARLADLCRRDGISRAEAVRRAVARLLADEGRDAAGTAFGLWRNRKINPIAHQRRLRREWDTTSARRRRPRAAR